MLEDMHQVKIMPKDSQSCHRSSIQNSMVKFVVGRQMGFGFMV